jgi:hypothetical protein
VDRSRKAEPERRALAGCDALPELGRLKPSAVYNSYWRFAAERQNVFFQRLEGHPPPWTSDRVIQAYKFTNAYRASDRVSQYLIRNVIYRSDLPRDTKEVVFRILLFKVFNKIETWELLQEELGPLTYYGYSFERYDKVLSRAMTLGRRIYSAAYIMPSGGSLGYERKHQNHLDIPPGFVPGTMIVGPCPCLPVGACGA